MNDKQKIDLNKGSINFWIPNNLFEYDDNQAYKLVNYSNSKGSVFIVKDDDNRLKFFHVITNKGRTDVEVDVSDLSAKERHMVTATWSIANKEISLYIDGDKKSATSKIR